MGSPVRADNPVDFIVGETPSVFEMIGLATKLIQTIKCHLGTVRYSRAQTICNLLIQA